HIDYNVGFAHASVYDPVGNAWSSLPDMNAGRWYPTNTALANGNMLVIGGDINHNSNTLPQIWDVVSKSWINLSSALLNLPNYPRMFLAPNGKLFYAGENWTTRYLDPAQNHRTGAWTIVANTKIHTDLSYGSAVMYDEGKVLLVGGGDPPTKTAEVIDLTA